jgi:hypothetical protein
MGVKMSEKYWAEEFEDRVEINPRNNSPIYVNIGGKSDCVVVDKLYGPMGSEAVRITMNSDYEWVVERQNLDTEEWEVKARWYIQETWKEDKKDKDE